MVVPAAEAQSLIMKALYIEADVDERKASAMLEAATSPIFLSREFLCIFTVVSNISTGLECTEHTCYDVILINHDLNNGVNAFQFARTLRNVGAKTPIILVNEEVSSDLLHIDGGSLFCCLLQKPFSARVLCDAILTSMEQNIIKIQGKRPAAKKRAKTRTSRRFTDNDYNTARVESEISDLDHDDLEPSKHQKCNNTDNNATSVIPFAPPVGNNIDDLNIGNLLLHGDFDLVYLSNCSLLDDIKSDT
eukprot:gene34220-44205_t